VALMVGVVLGNSAQRGRLEPAPVASRTAAPARNIPGLSPARLTAGPAPTVDYVHDGTWIRVGGETVKLADPGSLLADRGDSLVGFNHGLFAVRDLDSGPGERLGYSRDGGQPTEVPGVDPRVLGGAQPGPEGTVLIPVVGGYAVGRADGSWSVAKHFGDPAAPDAPPIAPARDAVFHAVTSGSTTLVRRSELDSSAKTVDNELWTRPVTSVPTEENLLVLADAQGCQQVILSDPFRPAWTTCEWDVRSLAADGVHAVAFSVEYGWAVVDLRRIGPPDLVLGTDEVVDADSFRFDRSGRLNLVIRSASGQSAIATCTEATCSLAVPWSSTPYVLVQPSGS
jgi:hypothetical protein